MHNCNPKLSPLTSNRSHPISFTEKPPTAAVVAITIFSNKNFISRKLFFPPYLVPLFLYNFVPFFLTRVVVIVFQDRYRETVARFIVKRHHANVLNRETIASHHVAIILLFVYSNTSFFFRIAYFCGFLWITSSRVRVIRLLCIS